MRKIASSSSSLWKKPLRHFSGGLSKKFDYRLYRQVAEQACNAALTAVGRPKEEKIHTAVITPFGFEIFCAPYLLNPAMPLKKSWPNDPTRLYPALRTPDGMSRTEAENFACLFAAFFRIFAQQHYLELHNRLVYMEVHHNGRYSHLKPEDCTVEKLKTLKTMHIAYFGSTTDILEHYAKYVVCLFGDLTSNNRNMPEIRSFDEAGGSKTGRNRLFQLFTMCHALGSALLPDLPEFTPEQQELFQAIFYQLRIQNPSELIREIPTTPLPISEVEYQIRDKLVFPWLELLRKSLAETPGERGFFTSEPYYNGENLLKTTLPRDFANRAQELVAQTYLAFPDLSAGQALNSSSPARR